MTLTALALRRAVLARAAGLGFDRAAAGPVEAPPTAAAFEQWLGAGYAGSMAYLARTRALRLDPTRLLPGCRSVVAVALNYARGDDGEAWRPVARYARGADYHDVMRPRLRALVAFLAEAVGAESRAAVDTSAVLERDLAAQAGLGWIAKNTNLIAPGLGSWFFIGIVLTTAEIAGAAGVANRCGSCTACLDACPTQAFVAPYVLDARRCISYLTIEHRGGIHEALRPAMGGWAFGCDVCQEVCPWNRHAPPSREPALAPSAPMPPLEEVLAMDEAGFRARFGGSAIARAKRAGLARNAAIALGNRGDAGATAALARAGEDPEPSVQDAARWALARLQA